LTDSAYDVVDTDSFEIARTLSFIALDMATELQYEKGVSDAYSRLGLYYDRIGRHDSALTYFLQALEVRRKIGEPDLIAYAFTNCAGQSGVLRQQETTLRFLDSAQFYAKQFNDTAYIVRLMQQKALFYINEGNLERARSIFIDQKQICRMLKDTYEMVNNYLNLGNIENQQERLGQSNLYLDSGLLLAQHLGVTDLSIYLYLGKLSNAIKQGQVSEAEEYYVLASNLHNQGYGEEDDGSNLAHALYEIKYKAKQYKQAADAAISFANRNDSIVSYRNASLLAEMETKYQTAEKVTQNKLLKTEVSHRKWISYFLGVGLLLLLGFGFFFYRNYKQKQSIAKQALQLKENEISQILRSKELETFDAALRGQDEERNRIAQELHDGLTNTLVVAKTNFETLKLDMQAIEAKNKQSLEQISSMLSQATDEVRKISHDLYAGSVVNFGIETALHQISDAISQSNPIEVHFMSKNAPKQLSQSDQINLYRVAQELLSNSLKYAKANQIHIQLIGHDEENYSFTYEDNGIGFDLSQAQSGMGLKNIESRIQKLGGTHQFESQPDQGMSFSANLQTKPGSIL